MRFQKTTPIIRVFDEIKAREFYVDFLGSMSIGSTDSRKGASDEAASGALQAVPQPDLYAKSLLSVEINKRYCSSKRFHCQTGRS